MNEQATQGTDTPAKGTGDQGTQNDQKQPAGQKFEKAMDALKGEMEAGQPSRDEQKLSDNADKGKKTDDTSIVDWEKRYKDLQSESDRKVSDESKKMETYVRSQLAKDVNYIHEVAQFDEALADRIIKSEMGEKHGITSYKQLIEAVERSKMPDSQRQVLEKVEGLEKKLNETTNKLTEKEKEEAQVFLASFKEQHPDFEGDVEKETMRFFKATPEITFEDAYNYTKYKMGIKEDVNVTEERIVRNLKSKDTAGSIPSSGSKGGTKPAGRKLSQEEVNFLDGIGARKTLEKHGF